ncbi:UNVERIFIED_CONTAM: hypothetical protein O8I53_05290 [Campylobacter lari]
MALNIYNFDNLPKFNQPIYLLGSFESFHLGHNALYIRAQEIKKEYPNRDIVLVFFKDMENMQKYNNPYIFTDFENRIQAFANLGFKYAIYLEFNKIKNLTADEFIDKLLLKQKNNLFTLIVGKDYKFGYKALGTSESLIQKFGDDRVIIVEHLKVGDNLKISTSFIKECVELGDIELANSLNLFYVSFNAKVLSKKYNQAIELIPNQSVLMPRAGLYLVYIEMNTFTYYAILKVDYDLSCEVEFIDFKLKDDIEIDARVKLIKSLRFFKELNDAEITNHDRNFAKKEFLKSN